MCRTRPKQSSYVGEGQRNVVGKHSGGQVGDAGCAGSCPRPKERERRGKSLGGAAPIYPERVGFVRNRTLANREFRFGGEGEREACVEMYRR